MPFTYAGPGGMVRVDTRDLPYLIFAPEMRVRLRRDERLLDLKGDEWEVSEVKDFRDCCDCGGAPLGGHNSDCIRFMWNLEAGHHQRLTIKDKDGSVHHASASWFVPA